MYKEIIECTRSVKISYGIPTTNNEQIECREGQSEEKLAVNIEQIILVMLLVLILYVMKMGNKQQDSQPEYGGNNIKQTEVLTCQVFLASLKVSIRMWRNWFQISLRFYHFVMDLR